MKLKHEIRQVEAPHSLIFSNNSTRDTGDGLQKEKTDVVSPETLNYRLQRGWQHLQEFPDTFNNNNNNNEPPDLNHNTIDDVILSSASYVEGDYRAMSSEDSGSSSEDESSASYSDTSPLLDVSSLGNSDVSLDSDMSEDSTSTSSSSSGESLLDGCNNNNNNDDDEGPSMQSSWMSYSSAGSSPSVAGPSKIVLPDVLPVSNVSTTSDRRDSDVEITFENKRFESGDSRMGGECCLVEITTQPDIQVDIKLNSVSPRNYRENIALKHGNTYPRETKNSKKYPKLGDASTWIVNDSFEDHYEEGTSKYWALGEGIRLNNFTIVNGFKTLSLTELVKPKTNKEAEIELKQNYTQIPDNSRFQKMNNSQPVNAYRNFERNYSKLPSNIHMCCKDNWRFQKDNNRTVKPKNVVENPIKCNTIQVTKPEFESRSNSQKATVEKPIEVPKQSLVPRLTNLDDNSNKFSVAEKLPQKENEINRKDTNASQCPKAKPNDSKLSSPELFEVYTMPHINWAAISKASRESDWIRKRRNDREEIRRKLAMDSDTEDYISEKLSQHRENDSSYDRLKGSGNLQICFMNEAAKDQDFANDSPTELINEKQKPTASRVQMPLHLPCTSISKCDKGALKTQNNNNSEPLVTKRQRPKFFFNRPRSWHAAKSEETSYPEEDFLARHLRLQAEAREALAQAKDMARMQMEIERQKKKKSPIAEMVGLPFPDGKNLLSHHALLAMNVAQLQVIVNDLHSQIETLNEDLVKFLLERDDLHMEQDSMLVDIEDLTRYLGLKGSSSVTSSSNSQVSVNSSSSNKKVPKSESVRRSQSVHLKSKNLM